MALFEHDIKVGKNSTGRSKTDVDAFSAKLLKQFSAGGITGKQITGGMEVQGAQLGTMVKFMKSDLRIQASTNQFIQRGFRINKDSLSKVTEYYKLDEKVRKEERDFYKKTKQFNKEQHRKDRVLANWQKEMLKVVGKTKNNTNTLQTAAQLKLITSVTKRVGRLFGGGTQAGLEGVNAKVLKKLKQGTERALTQQTKQWTDQSKMEKIQTGIFKSIDSGIGLMVNLTEKGIQIQRRINQNMDDRTREKARILESQGIGPRQTRHDKNVLKRLEKKKRRDAKKIGGFFASDEEREARKNIQREARELKTLRKRGFTGRDIQTAKESGMTQTELVESGRHRRRRSMRGRGLSKFLKRAGGAGRMVGKLGKFGAKLIPGLGVITGAAMMASKAKEGDIFGAAVSGIGAAASAIPGLGPMVTIALESLAALLPGNIKDSINKFAKKLFMGIGFDKLLGRMGGTGGTAKDFGKLFADLGDALRKFGNLLLTTIMSKPFQNVLGKIGDFLVSAGDVAITGFTGILNFWSDIFGKKKGFGKAFMDNIWPAVEKSATELIPKFVSLIWSVFKILAEGVKTLVVSIIGKNAAKMFGIVVEKERTYTSFQTASMQHEKSVKEARVHAKSLTQMKGAGTVGLDALRVYNKTGKGTREALEAGLDVIRAEETSNRMTPSQIKSAKASLISYHSAVKSREETGEYIRRENIKSAIDSGSLGSLSETGDPSSTPSGNATKPVMSVSNLSSSAKEMMGRLAGIAKELNFGDIGLSEGYRTPERQAFLYSQGRNTPGKIVTNAKPGQSRHETGNAVDIFFKTGEAFDMKRYAQLYSSYISKYGEGSIVWGGNFSKLKDGPHFEATGKGVSTTPEKTTNLASAPSIPAETGIAGMFQKAKDMVSSGAVGVGLSGAMSGMATGILAKGAQMASSFASIPGMASGVIGGQTAMVIANAAKGAGTAAQHEMQRMNDAMNKALGNAPAMKKIGDNMGAVSEHTRAIANKQEEKDKTPLKAKKNRSLETLYGQYMSGVSFT